MPACHINADDVRERFNDWDFTEMGRRRQANRMKTLAEDAEAEIVIIDFVCPLREFRGLFNPDVVVFMDTIRESQFLDTNKIFQRPKLDENITFHVTDYNFQDLAQKIVMWMSSFDWRKPTVQMLGRWQPFHDGHVALFKKAHKKTGQVMIQVRDCEGWQNSNPFSFEEVKQEIISKQNFQLKVIDIQMI